MSGGNAITSRPALGDGVFGTAEFSHEDPPLYRWLLTREWDTDLPVVNFVGLNPSTANAAMDDPTMRRLLGFAQRWGFGKFVMTNLFAWRSPHPRDLRSCSEPVGLKNNESIRRAAAEAQLVVVCWGEGGYLLDRWRAVARFLPKMPSCFGTTRSGQPRHPLYLASSSNLEPFTGFVFDHEVRMVREHSGRAGHRSSWRVMR